MYRITQSPPRKDRGLFYARHICEAIMHAIDDSIPDEDEDPPTPDDIRRELGWDMIQHPQEYE